MDSAAAARINPLNSDAFAGVDADGLKKKTMIHHHSPNAIRKRMRQEQSTEQLLDSDANANGMSILSLEPRQQRRRQSVVTKRTSHSCFSLAQYCSAVFLSCLLLLPYRIIQAQSASSSYFQHCIGILQASDVSADNLLDRQEYASAVLDLSFHKIDIFNDFAHVPASVTNTYTSRDTSGSGVSISTTATNPAASLCSDLYAAIYPVWNLTIDSTTCSTAYRRADANANGNLDSTEYVAYVNALTNNTEAGLTFTQLPTSVQNVYTSFAAAGGSSSEIVPVSSDANFPANLCGQSALFAVAAKAGATDAVGPTAAPGAASLTPAPVGTTTGSTVVPTTILSGGGGATRAPSSGVVAGTAAPSFVGSGGGSSGTSRPTGAGTATQVPSMTISAGSTGSPNSASPSLTPSAASASAQPSATPSAIPSASSSPSIAPTIPAPTAAPTKLPVAVANLSNATQKCIKAMVQADVNLDNNLASDEYTSFVNILGQHTFPQAFRFLDASLIAIYNARRDVAYIHVPGIRSDPIPATDATALDTLCTDVWTSISNITGGVITPEGIGSNTTVSTLPPVAVTNLSNATRICVDALILSDVNKDDGLASDEYTSFVNILGQHTFPKVFRYLNASLIAIFETRSNFAILNVTGIHSNPIPASNATVLDNFCTQVWTAISNITGGAITPATVSFISATEPPVAVANLAPSTKVCINAMAQADVNKDEALASNEYTSFVNILGQNTFPKAFRYLNESLTAIYKARRDVSVIHVPGIRSDPIPSANATALDGLCNEVWTAIIILSNGLITPPTNESKCPEPANITDDQLITCQTAMIIGDMNRDDKLDELEWIRFLNRLTLNTYLSVLQISELPAAFQVAFAASAEGLNYVDVAGSKPATTPTTANLDHLRFVCAQVYGAINCVDTSALGGNVTLEEHGGLSDADFRACTVSLTISDIDRNEQIDEVEYVRFLDRLTANEFSEIPFSLLPPSLQHNFMNLTLGRARSFDIAGSKPGIVPTATQSTQLRSICSSTLEAIASFNIGTRNSTNETYSFMQTCTSSLLFADANGDELMGKAEFVRFVSRLLNVKIASYTDLAPVFQKSFNDLSVGGKVNLTGLRSGASATLQQFNHLTTVCDQTEQAIADYTPTVADDNFLCDQRLRLADTDHNNLLSKEEYVSLIYRNIPRNGISFDSLRPEIRHIYDLMRNRDDEPDLSGSNPNQVPTKADQDRLMWICSKANEAFRLVDPSKSVDGPTAAPSNELVIFNSFLTSSTKNIPASDLVTGYNRQGLDEAYASFVSDLVGTLTMAGLRGRRHLRVTNLKPDSSKIDHLENSKCPENLGKGLSCLTAYASFILLTDGLGNMDSFSQSYQALSQIAIDQGELDQKLRALDPKNDLRVVSSLSPVTPQSTESKSNVGTLGLGSLIGISVGCALFLAAVCIGVYVLCDMRRHRVAADTDVSVKDSGKGFSGTSPYLDDNVGALSLNRLERIDEEDSDGYEQQEPSTDSLFEVVAMETRTVQSFPSALDPLSSVRNTSDEEMLSKEPAMEFTTFSMIAEELHPSEPERFGEFSFDAFHRKVGAGKATPLREGVSALTDTSMITAEPAPRDSVAASTEGDAFVSAAVPFEVVVQPGGDGDLAFGSAIMRKAQAETSLLTKTEEFRCHVDADADQVEEVVVVEEDFTEEEVTDDDESSLADDGQVAAAHHDVPASEMVAALASPEPLTAHKLQGSKEKDAPLISEVQVSESVEQAITTRGMLQVSKAMQAENSGDVIVEVTGESEAVGDLSEEEVTSEEDTDDDDEEEETESEEEEDDSSDDESENAPKVATTPIDKAKQSAYRAKIAELVSQVVPGEIDNVDAMMEQFVGREEELIITLQNMTASDASSSGEEESSDEDESSGDEEESSDEEESDEEDDSDEESSDEDEDKAPAAPGKLVPKAAKKNAESDGSSDEDDSSDASDSS